MLIQTTDRLQGSECYCTPQEVAQEAFWLAWQACDGPSGMGVLQDNPDACKAAVIANVNTQGDYPGTGVVKTVEGPNELYGDYVFGRMVKLAISWTDAGVVVPDNEPHLEYQGWAKTYASYDKLIAEAVVRLLKAKYESKLGLVVSHAN